MTVITDASDYAEVLEQLKETGETTLETRRKLAAKVFRQTAAYDALIASYMTDLTGEEFPNH